MNEFSPADAGLEGFRITKENPRAFLLWAMFSFAVSVAGAVITVLMPENVRNAMATLASDETPDASVLLDAIISLLPLLIFGLAVQCVMAAAVYRIIMRHDDERFGYLRLGPDEIRLMMLTLIYVVMFMVLLVLVTLVAALIGGVAGVLSQPLGIVVGAVAELGAIGVMIYVAVRLSLAPPETFAQRRLVLFDSWKLTHGQFWRLLGAYVLAFACIIFMGILAMILFSALAGVAMLATGHEFSDLSAVFAPDETSLRSYIHPLMIAYMLMGSVFTALYYAVIAAPGAVAYRALHDRAPPAP